MKNKKAFQFSFSWIFAIFIGAVIIFLAIYFATQLVDTKRGENEAKTGRQLGILLNPIETNLEDIKYTPITIRKPTRIFNGCELATQNNPFGSQEISASVRSGVGQDWLLDPGVKSTFHNKYLFSSKMTEGEDNFYILSKPFYFPFKVADIIILWSDNQEYCFINPPQQIANDIEDQQLENIKISDCSQESIKVCFQGACDIIVNDQPNGGTVSKGLDVYPYVTSSDSNNRYPLLYAAIFSDFENYECQLQRLMARTEKLTELYEQKRIYLDTNDCNIGDNIQTDINDLRRSLIINIDSIKNSESDVLIRQSLNNAKSDADKLNDDNNKLNCKLF